MSKILVIGSANMDTTHYLSSEFPEDITQESANEIVKTARVLGGKGANQARATKLQSDNADVSFIGCIGKDEAGLSILEEFKKVGIDYSGMTVLDGVSTDGRIISVDKHGENRMIGHGNCIKHLSPELLADKEALLESADIIAIQMKMPPESVEYVVDYCTRHNKPLIIDPTPPEKSSILTENNLALLNQATYLTPNEEEAFALSRYMEGQTLEEANSIFRNTPKEVRLKEIEALVERFPNIIATVGGDGVIYSNHGQTIRKPTYPTVCKDSTGAGDTFNGAFIASLSRGEDLDTAIDYALMTSSIKVRYEGAQNGVPTYQQTKESLGKFSQENSKNNEQEER